MGAGGQSAVAGTAKRQRTPRLITFRSSLLLAVLCLVILNALGTKA